MTETMRRVTILFQKDFGTEGSGGYLDKTCTTRDMIQNYLVQVTILFAVEGPVQHNEENTRKEKVKLLQCILSIECEDCIRK